MAYRPRQFGLIRDETNVAEIAGHRPALVTRIHNDVPFEERDPNLSLRGQPDALLEDESYHRGEAVKKFNRELRGGHAGRNDGEV
jgi:hypothetical protein